MGIKMKIDKVTVKILSNADQLGKVVAGNVSDRINKIISVKGKANILKISSLQL